MAGWSQSPLLQALGWATLNSLWQMALLWIVFSFSQSLFRLSPLKKYYAAVLALVSGFLLFVFSFISYWAQGASLPFDEFGLSHSYNVLHPVTTSAALTYIALLAFPAVRLYKNWRFLQQLKKYAFKKAKLDHRLFVQKMAPLLGVRKKVKVFVSDLVSSPVTVGYLKPIILLPIAALNQLSLQQTEAVLLHELSHIRRSDYLINWVTTIIHTLLYFNPFVKLFVRVMETERENSCDELVLRFGYDKVSYASALLMLEKSSVQTPVLILAATGNKPLLRRIERIVGLERKPRFRFADFAGFLGALFCILVINALLFTKKAVSENNNAGSFAFFTDPTLLLEENGKDANGTKTRRHQSGSFAKGGSSADNDGAEREVLIFDFHEEPFNDAVNENMFIPVEFDEIEAELTPVEKEHVSTTIKQTKKVLKTLQWQEVEKNIADAMTPEEKAVAKEEYMQEVESVDWQNLEKNLKHNYDQIDWNKINTELAAALTVVTLDSISINYKNILNQLAHQEKIAAKCKTATVIPVPDVSLEHIQKQKEEVKAKLEEVKRMRTKKVVRL